MHPIKKEGKILIKEEKDKDGNIISRTYLTIKIEGDIDDDYDINIPSSKSYEKSK